MDRKTSLFDTIFASSALVLYGGAIISPLRILRGLGQQQIGESEPVMATCQALILVILIITMTLRRRRILPLLGLITPYLLIVAVCIGSTLWSDHPLSTLRRGSTLAICVMFGVYCYDAFGLRKLVTIISAVAISLSVVSLLAFFALPQVGQEQAIEYGGAMRGVFAQKNGMAEYMLLGIVCCSYKVIETKQTIRFFFSVTLLYACIILGQSVTSLLIATLVLVMTGWLVARKAPRARLIFAFAVSSFFIIFIAALVLAPDQVFQLLGRDQTLTGRLPLWRLVISAIAERPLLGHGYSGFWDANSIEVQYLWQRAGWVAPDSHNGYLDIVLQIGVFGIVLYGWLWVRILRLGWKASRSGTLPIAAWILLFMVINLLVNLDEGPLPWADEFTAAGPAALITLELWNMRYRRSTGSTGRSRAILDPHLMRAVIPMRTAGRLAAAGPSQANVMPNTGHRGFGNGL